MSPLTAFKIEFLRWSIAQGGREVHDDYATLRTIAQCQSNSENPASFFLDFVSGKSVAERELLSQALAKRMNLRNLSLAGEALSASEEAAWQEYETVRRLAGISQNRPGCPMDHATTKQFRRVATDALGPVLGAPESDTNMLRFVTVMGAWRMVTFIDHDIDQYALRYSHSVFGPGDRLPVILNVSCLMWLGISAETRWSRVGAGNVGGVVTALQLLCGRFHSALPGLIR